MRRLVLLFAVLAWVAPGRAASKGEAKGDFRTSDRCVACHNELKTKEGEDISIGLQWSASVMANSARDPYWQGSVRREALDHPAATADIENECAACHMEMEHLIRRDEGKKTPVFSNLRQTGGASNAEAEDGVSCSVCHQIENQGLGEPATYNGEVVIAPSSDHVHRAEYGPFDVDSAHQRVMQSSTAGFVPQSAAHIRNAALCATCHTLITTARDEAGNVDGKLPEQMPYQEWQHSDYASRESCQDCHMPAVNEPTRISSVYGPDRVGLHRHVFVGGNLVLTRLLMDHRGELDTKAQPEQLQSALDRIYQFLKTQAARVSLEGLQQDEHTLSFRVHAENLTGHKLPTAFPSRRVWLHVTVRDQHGRIVFESGHLNPDGSIVGNDNDEDPGRFEPHYTEITRPDQVEIYEDILKDNHGHVTTGLIAAVDYLKDNRLLPRGFDKATAAQEIRVVGAAADDPNFTGGGSTVQYRIDTGSAQGPFHVEAELWYQPVGFRWAHNFEPYKATEPQRFVRYFDQVSNQSAALLASAEATH
ncbi:hypothetical protein DYQ86_27090 [Acidobacteria bacterium AB60]|nr:hypothetical protein DYQ86_27090 [Acidobacteria bacterium AB60]